MQADPPRTRGGGDQEAAVPEGDLRALAVAVRHGRLGGPRLAPCLAAVVRVRLQPAQLAAAHVEQQRAVTQRRGLDRENAGACMRMGRGAPAPGGGLRRDSDAGLRVRLRLVAGSGGLALVAAVEQRALPPGCAAVVGEQHEREDRRRLVEAGGLPLALTLTLTLTRIPNPYS